MSALEVIAALFGFVCVAFYIARSIWSWPAGLVQVLLYIVVFWQSRLYADMVLHGIYVGLQVYGWWAWSSSSGDHGEARKTSTKTVEVRHMSVTGQILSLVAVILSAMLITWILRRFTDGQSPKADAFVSSASLVAQILLAYRYIENWVYWIVVDLVAVGLFWNRELYPTAILYALFFVMACIGFVTWYKALRCSVDDSSGKAQ